MRVDQWVPALHRGDAIGDSARLMCRALRAWGHEADVYALDLDEAVVGEGRPWSEWRPSTSDDVVLMHYALPSPLTEALAHERCRRVLIHHNITPAEHFVGYDPEMVRICTLGREQLAGLRDHVELGLGDSEFNRRELEALGFRRTGVLPIYLDFERYREPPNPVLRRLLDDGRTNLLFVGRVAPNKRHDDLIRLAWYWREFISPDLRLVLVGKLPRRETGLGEPLDAHYFDTLQRFFYEQGFGPDEIVFTGHLDHRELLACFATADVFVSMSDHEGFGVPLVEAMLMDVPVLAYGAAAVPFTLGGAGLQFDTKDVAAAAEAAHLLATDPRLRNDVLEGQRRRLLDFAPAAVEARLREALAGF